MNPVAKNMPKVHKPSVEVDRKREEKKTGGYLDTSDDLILPTNGNTESVDLHTEED